MRLGVIGSGYVGLVSGTCLAEFGHTVVCMDNNPDKIASLRQGQIPIYEPGLDDLVQKQIQAGRLSFTTHMRDAVADMDAVFIAVGTPPRNGDDGADLSYVFAAAEEMAQHLTGYTVIVDKSTVPVGTARKVSQAIRAANPQAVFDVVSNPEFLREGAAIDDFMRPDRIVVGCDTDRAAEVMRSIYRPLYLNDIPMVVTNPETAEVTKYAANAFLATKITFINEIARLCEVAGADVQAVAKAMGMDKRIAPKFLHAGPGYGGSCFPKDTKALAQTGRDMGAIQSVVESVIAANEQTKKILGERIIQFFDGSCEGKTIAVLGVAFKQQTDDMREASSLTILPMLQHAGAKIRAFDPAAMKVAQHMLPGVEWIDDPYQVAEGADALVVLTEWNEFRGLDMNRLAEIMRTPVMFDFRNLYKTDEMATTPFTYFSLGRATIYPRPRAIKANVTAA